MKKNVKLGTAFATMMLAVASLGGLTACSEADVIMIWGPKEHEQLYLDAIAAYKEAHPEFTTEVKFGPQGDAKAYKSMSVDVESGAEIVSFPNDQLINLRRIGGIGKLNKTRTDWIKANHVSASVEAGKVGDDYYAYPLSADNGYEFIYNKDAFRGTDVWDTAKDALKEGYTFRDLYKALDQRGAQAGHEKWANGVTFWPMGSAWYEAGVFLGVGGDYSVTFDKDGKQESATCDFTYTTKADGTKDFTHGLEATRCMINAMTNEDGTVSKHWVKTGDEKPEAYGDAVDKYIAKDSEKPLAGVMSWNNPKCRTEWGEDYAVAKLPALSNKNTVFPAETETTYTWKTFAGFKLLGVNPMSKFARKSPENLELLHEIAQYLSDKDASLKRFDETGMGPSNIKAQENEKVKNDAFLSSLNAQYNLPEGKGVRVQDSTPSNFWTPITNFGIQLLASIDEKKEPLDTMEHMTAALEALQNDIVSAAK